MKKIITVSSLFTLVISFFVLPSVVSAAPLTVGNDNTVRGQVDGNSNFAVIDINHPSTALGVLNSFAYYATSTNPFRFVLVDSTSKVLWLSDAITPAGTGAQTYTPPSYVVVHQGDNLGLYFPSTGTITFDSTGAIASSTASGLGVPIIGATLTFTATSSRTYSFVGNGQIGELPSVPSILSPSNGATLTSAAFTQIDWTDAAGTFTPMTYQYEVYSDTAYTNLLYQSGWLTDSSIPTAGSADGVYYVRVRAQDSLGDLSNWSNGAVSPYVITVSEAVLPGLPTVPAITLPANGANLNSSILTKVDWTNSTGSSTPITYQYEAYSDAAYTSLVYQSGWLSASEIPTPNTPDGVYYLRVRAKDNSGNLSDWSNSPADPYVITVSTSVTPGIISAPMIFFPAKGSTINSLALSKVNWTNATALATPITYQYEAYSDAAYSSLVYQSGWLPVSEIPTPNTPEGVYYVRVRAKDNSGNLGGWSNGPDKPYSFTVNNSTPIKPGIPGKGHGKENGNDNNNGHGHDNNNGRNTYNYPVPKGWYKNFDKFWQRFSGQIQNNQNNYHSVMGSNITENQNNKNNHFTGNLINSGRSNLSSSHRGK